MSAYAPVQRMAAPWAGLSVPGLLGGIVSAFVGFMGLGLAPQLAGVETTEAGSDPISLTLILAGYGLMAVSLGLWVGRALGRDPGALIGPWTDARSDVAVAARRTLGSLAAILVLSALAFALSVTLFVDTLTPPDAENAGGRTRGILAWLTALPFAAIAILIQSGSEEIVFRGYLMPALRARTDRPLIWLGLPVALFGLAHLPYAQTANEALFVFVVTGGIGLALGDLTARTGNIGAAVGFHWAWNLWQFTLFGELDGPMSGFALFLTPAAPTPTASPMGLILSLLSIMIPWLAVRVGLRR